METPANFLHFTLFKVHTPAVPFLAWGRILLFSEVL
jgi:hypothetical protein